MLNVHANRLDYGAALRPPAGYKFHSGIVTTYSLDMSALTTAAIALALDLDLDGGISGEKIAILEAMDQLQGRLTVFHQAGKIKVPAKFNRLYALLEPLLNPIAPVGHGSSDAFTSFHPKLWCLRFSSSTSRTIRYRLLVLSRNLTLDRSWDLAVRMEGELQQEIDERNKPLADFLRSLQPQASDTTSLSLLAKEIPRISWEYPPGIRLVEMCPGGGAHIRDPESRFSRPLKLGGNVGDVLVVSPFLDAGEGSVLCELEELSAGSRTLVSRADTLDRIGKDNLAGWRCYSLNEAIVDAEERHAYDDPQPQDLHAKLIVTTSGKTAHWHIGSANATNAAFGEMGDASPRNTEFMLRLTGSTERIGPAAVFDGWMNDKSRPFALHEFSLPTPNAEKIERDRRILVHRLTAAIWTLKCRRAPDGRYVLRLLVDADIKVPEGFGVEVQPYGASTRRPLQLETEWPAIDLTDITAFIQVFITTPIIACNLEFMLQARLDLDAEMERRQAIFKALIDTPAKLLHYVNLILDMDASRSRWLGIEHEKGGDDDIFDIGNPDELFEKLMRCAARDPLRVDRVLTVVDRLRKQAVPLPTGLEVMLNGFRDFRRGVK